MKKILVTGGAGYIGSHTTLELLNKGYEVVVLDNLANGKLEAIRRVEDITEVDLPFYEIDLRDYEALKKLFNKYEFNSVIHFAGYKAVGESVAKPLLYYSNNVSATISLLNVMQKYKVGNIVFSSSCTVYGKPNSVPVKETDELAPTNPYGSSKLLVEQILKDSFQAFPLLSVSILRYFNPIGAHPSGQIGEDPTGIPNNLLPYVSRVAAGHLDELQVFGDDYETHDGTGVRDYIHVVDLAKAHVVALEELINNNKLFEIYNLGTGQGYSVLDVIKAFEKTSGQKIKYRIAKRRPGDIGIIFADPSKVNRKLGWFAERGLEKMCSDVWNWQLQKTNGL